MYRFIFRPLLFLLDAERAHGLVIWLARLVWHFKIGRRLTRVFFMGFSASAQKTFRLGSILLDNPIGLAAGFDKNGLLVSGIENLGFGFIETGTVTPYPQQGNAKPRIFRVLEQHSILNRLGFNNDGAEAIAARLSAIRSQIKIPLGINIGKQATTPNSSALYDYEMLFKIFCSLADYITVNLSSPNTPGLRELQSNEFILVLSKKILELKLSVPIFLKLSPDLSVEQLQAICSFCGKDKPFSGLVLTNTIPTDLGGLSGRPLKQKSLLMLKQARAFLEKDIPIISVGGIETVDDVRERLNNGANAIQVYTALIYKGPGLIQNWKKELTINL